MRAFAHVTAKMRCSGKTFLHCDLGATLQHTHAHVCFRVHDHEHMKHECRRCEDGQFCCQVRICSWWKSCGIDRHFFDARCGICLQQALTDFPHVSTSEYVCIGTSRFSFSSLRCACRILWVMRHLHGTFALMRAVSTVRVRSSSHARALTQLRIGYEPVVMSNCRRAQYACCFPVFMD